MRQTLLLLLSAISILTIAPALRAGERWNSGGDARWVIGQTSFTSSESGRTDRLLNAARDAAVDPSTGKVFVVDATNHRILRWSSVNAYSNGKGAEAVIGQPNFTGISLAVTQSDLYVPQGIDIDSSGSLWVCDGYNRVLLFKGAASVGNYPPADLVLGQPDYDVATPGLSDSLMDGPKDLAIAEDGTLFVADSGNERVLVFLDAENATKGQAADFVLGQTNKSSDTAAAGATGMSAPRGVAVDNAGNLFVADSGNQRVLRFDLLNGLSDGMAAESVLGQSDFAGTDHGGGRTGLFGPWDIEVDIEGRLWVAELTARRLTGFSGAAQLPNGAPADVVLGQPDFDSYEGGTTASLVQSVSGVGVDSAGRVYLADSQNDRFLVFSKDRYQPDLRIGKSVGTANRGNNRYNRSGGGQAQPYVLRNPRKARFVIRVQNDGNLPESFKVRGARTNARFRINVFTITGGRRNITGGAKLGTFQTGAIGPQGLFNLRHEIQPRGRYRTRNGQMRAWMQGTAVSDGETDRVVSLVRNRPKRR